MKRSLLIIVLCVACVWAGSAQEEKVKKSIFRAAIYAGFNATQVAGDNLAGYRKIGANVGPSAFVMLPKNFSVSFELLYSMKGSRPSNNELFIDAQNGGVVEIEDYKLILDYLDVPIMINYHDKDRAIFSLGFIYNNLVRYKETIGGVVQEGNPYRTAGVEFLGSVTFIFKQHYGVNLRGTYSLSDIRNEPTPYPNNTGGSQRNIVLSMRLMYMF